MRAMRLLLCSTIASGTLLSVPALAQSNGEPQTQAAAPDTSDEPAASQSDSGELVVTGTRIRTPGNRSTVPITSITSEEIYQTGNTFLGELIEKLPSTRSTVSQQNSKDDIGIAGLNLIDLRGLGTSRTLVLQNGRRHVSSRPGLPGVDVNSIPSSLVERIDIVTGGSSAIYGSDAVAGIVNFVLKRDFDGLEMRGQAGISSRGDRGSYRASVTAGRNFGDDRGNIAFSAEYSRARAVANPDRADLLGSYSGNSDFAPVDNPGNEPNGTDGIPDRTFLTNLKFLSYDPNGVFIPSRNTSANGSCIVAAACLPNGFARAFRFLSNGTLVEAQIGNDLRAKNGGASSTVQFSDTGYSRTVAGQLVPGVEQYNINLLGHYDFSDAFSPYFEAKYVRGSFNREANQPFINTGGQQGGAADYSLLGLPGANAVPIFFDNAYLDPSAASFIKSLLPAGANSFLMSRVNLEFGRPVESGHRETYRGVIGVEGDFNGDWHYDLSFNYGKFRQRSTLGGLTVQRYALATDAVRNPTNGQIVCRSQLPGQVTTSPTGNAVDIAALTSDIAACVPINLFGIGSPSQAAIDYFSASTEVTIESTQKVVSGYMSGDLSQLFELPGGPVAFALGAEWRQEDGFYDTGDAARTGRLNIAPDNTFDPPTKFEVKEVFGELRVPILKDLAFFDELTVNAAARVADYKGRTGTVVAWNAGGVWAPVRDLRLRANYAVSVRAPDLQSLYQITGLTEEVISDPCSIENITSGSSTRKANCAAAGVPTGYVDPKRGQSIPVAFGGNPLLREETSRSLTVGGVFQPRFLPGFTVSADYFDIRIDDAIAQPGGQAIVDNCYDAASLNNQYCSVVFRDPTTHGFSTQAPFYGLIDSSVNYAKLTARGIDFEASYRANLTGLGRLDARLVGTYLIERNNFLDPNNANASDQQLLEAGTPQLQVNFNLGFKSGPVTFGYQARYISKQVASQFSTIEALQSVGGNPPQNADALDPKFTPSVMYHDFSLAIDVGRQYQLYGGVDNAFDRQPPFARYGFNLDRSAAIYDSIGRFFYVGFVVRY